MAVKAADVVSILYQRIPANSSATKSRNVLWCCLITLGCGYVARGYAEGKDADWAMRASLSEAQRDVAAWKEKQAMAKRKGKGGRKC